MVPRFTNTSVNKIRFAKAEAFWSDASVCGGGIVNGSIVVLGCMAQPGSRCALHMRIVLRALRNLEAVARAHSAGVSVCGKFILRRVVPDGSTPANRGITVPSI